MNQLNFKSKLLKIMFLLSLGIAVIIGCSDDDDSSSSASTQYAYNGPGSVWNLALFDDDTCTITRAADLDSAIDLTINCSYERLTTGFLKFTVEAAAGTDAPSAGETAWAIEVPGYATFLVPMNGDDSNLIAMLPAGECPGQDFTGNWVIVKKEDSGGVDATSTTTDWWGTFSWDESAGAATLPIKRAIDNSYSTIAGGSGDMSGTCSNGILEIGGDAIMYMNDNGAIVHTSVDDPDDASFIFALKSKAIASKANVAGDYACMLFDDSQSSGDKISPVACTVDTNGDGTCSIVTNIVSGATNGSVTIAMSGTVDNEANGFVLGDITDDGGNSGNLSCMVDIDVNSSDSVLFSCIGQSPGDNTNMFNFICIQTD